MEQAATVVGTKAIEGMANSTNPWIYLSGILVVAVLLAGRYVFTYLIKLDQSHRDESKEREKSLMTHLGRSNDLHERSTIALENMSSSVSSLEGRMDRIEKQTYKEGA